MANSHSTLSSLFVDIANAIRSKNGSTASIVADNFPSEINNLRIGFDYNNQEATSISDYQFYGCEDLNSVDCYNLTSIGTSAFENCKNLKAVILYDGIENVGESAFKGCDNLTEIYVAWKEDEIAGAPWGADNATIYYSSVGSVGLVYRKIGNGYEVSKGECIEADIRIPRNYNGLPVTSIGSYAFEGSSLTFITIPDSVTSIGVSAFRNCTNLTSITIPDSVTSIGGAVFYGCINLKTAGAIGGGYDYEFGWTDMIPSYAFASCKSLTSITIPDGVTSIGESAFNSSTNLTSITIPDSVTSIGNAIFRNCTSLTSITIPDSVTSIDSNAFSGCTSLTSITYTGAIAQWQAIIFGTNWNQNTPDYTIYCTDGDIAKDGTITYH